MTGRSQRGGANTPEEHREAFGVVGKIVLDLVFENDERRFTHFFAVFFHCDCELLLNANVYLSIIRPWHVNEE